MNKVSLKFAVGLVLVGLSANLFAADDDATEILNWFIGILKIVFSLVMSFYALKGFLMIVSAISSKGDETRDSEGWAKKAASGLAVLAVCGGVVGIVLKSSGLFEKSSSIDKVDLFNESSTGALFAPESFQDDWMDLDVIKVA